MAFAENYMATNPRLDIETEKQIRLEITFDEPVRSSGPGGQKVNKTASKIQARWYIDGSKAIPDEVKNRIKEQFPNRINKNGELFAHSQQQRSQPQNKEAAIQILLAVIAQASIPPKERKPTRPTRSSDERRLKDKAKQARRKDERRNPFDD